MQALVIGDIHGCLDELKELIQGIDRAKTRIILVGDLIDRGPESEGTIDFVRSNNIECVKGNHELMAEKCLPALDQYITSFNAKGLYELYESDWFYNGGHDVFNQYRDTDSLYKLATDIKWLAQLPFYIETGIVNDSGLELLVSHTWRSYKKLEAASRGGFNFLWSREQPGTTKNNSKYYNIYGHTPVDYVNPIKYRKGSAQLPEPKWFDGAAAIDTGCTYNIPGRGYLTGVYFPSLDVIQVRNKQLKGNT